MGDPIRELLDGGDWACANAFHGGLADVCTQLAGLVEPEQPELAHSAHATARLAQTDLAEATRRWADLSASLRRGHRRTLAPRLLGAR